MTRRQALGRLGIGLVGAAGGGLAAVAETATAGGPPPARLVAFRSRALRGPLHAAVHLPRDYARSGRRYSVVYFLHGLPASANSYLTFDWVAEALSRAGRAIVVVPQGTRRPDGDPEYHDWGPGRDWAGALASELPAWIDARYRTVPSREGRAIVGVSAGGYGAASLGLCHLETFSVVQSWSGYFRPTDPSGRHDLELGSARANEEADVAALVPTLRSAFARLPTALGFYVGGSDPVFVPANTSLDRALTAARVPHLFRVYPGGHSNALWQEHAPAWLGLALAHLA